MTERKVPDGPGGERPAAVAAASYVTGLVPSNDDGGRVLPAPVPVQVQVDSQSSDQGQEQTTAHVSAHNQESIPVATLGEPAGPTVVVSEDQSANGQATMAQKNRPRVASMPAAVQEPLINDGLMPTSADAPALASVSTESLSAADDVSPKRQDEFERFFGKRLTEDWTSNYQLYAQAQSRARAYSTASLVPSISSASSVSTASSAVSVASDSTEIQTEPSTAATVPPPPPDYLMVLATQSCDLQASLLLHGRLYLTRYHLCFRSNILGVKTEKIHPLKDLVSVQKGTTAKWIQNAIYVCMAGDGSAEAADSTTSSGSGEGSVAEDDVSAVTEGDDTSATNSPLDETASDKKGGKRGRDRSKSTSSKNGNKARSESRGRKHEPDGSKLYGYGSMADRDAMFSDVVQCWRVQAPDRHKAWMEREGRNPDGSYKDGRDPKQSRKRSGTSATMQTESDTTSQVDGDDDDRSSAAGDEGTSTPTTSPGVAKEPVKHTTCPGENLKELAIDATIALPLDETYKMLYHNRDFIINFYSKDKGISDPQISDWAENEEGKRQRTLNFVIAINNPIGPSSSDCNGVETIEVEKEGEAYAIRSETKTPNVPTGKNFKVVTRTCLTQTDIRGRPATRVYCSTQVDWSSSSLLKGTVTPAVIKGQKEHYRDLVDSARRWIRSHPEEFTQPPQQQDSQDGAGPRRKGLPGRGVSFREPSEGESTGAAGVEQAGEMKVRPPLLSRSSSFGEKTMLDYAMEIPANPVMLAITALCAFLLVRDMMRLIF